MHRDSTEIIHRIHSTLTTQVQPRTRARDRILPSALSPFDVISLHQAPISHSTRSRRATSEPHRAAPVHTRGWTQSVLRETRGVWEGSPTLPQCLRRGTGRNTTLPHRPFLSVRCYRVERAGSGRADSAGEGVSSTETANGRTTLWISEGHDQARHVVQLR